MRAIETILGTPVKTLVTPKKTLHGEAIELLKAEKDMLQRECDVLRSKVLGHDKEVAKLTRVSRSATEDADVLLEAVSLLARVVSNSRKEERAVREQVRKLLESHDIPPPSTLGSSRKRQKSGASKPKTTENA